MYVLALPGKSFWHVIILTEGIWITFQQLLNSTNRKRVKSIHNGSVCFFDRWNICWWASRLKPIMYCNFFTWKENVKITCHVFGTVNICWLNCWFLRKTLLATIKTFFLPLDLIIIVLRLGSGKDVSKIQFKRNKHIIVSKQSSSNPQAFTVSPMSFCSLYIFVA